MTKCMASPAINFHLCAALGAKWEKLLDDSKRAAPLKALL